MNNPIYQVQLEVSDKIYSFEIATKEFDAVDIAVKYIGKTRKDCHVGGYCRIGYTKEGMEEGILKFREINNDSF